MANGWGGKREGAGAKKLPEKFKRVPLMITLTPGLKHWLQDTGEVPGQVIEQALYDKFELTDEELNHTHNHHVKRIRPEHPKECRGCVIAQFKSKLPEWQRKDVKCKKCTAQVRRDEKERTCCRMARREGFDINGICSKCWGRQHKEALDDEHYRRARLGLT